jgi:hypothetical protein
MNRSILLLLLPLALVANGAHAARPRFTDSGAQTVLDAKTGLEWTADDGGAPLTWTASGERCAALGAGWRMPTAAELSDLYDPSGKLTTPCGPGICKLSPLFHLHEVCVWSSDAGGGDAIIVCLDENKPTGVLNGSQHSFQSLCVAPQKREREGKPLKPPK